MSATNLTIPKPASWTARLRGNLYLVVTFLLLAALPFVIALFDGQSFPSLWANEPGSSKFIQGFVVEILILGIYAISYDLIFGITGLLSFGHAMFFAVGAYLTGVLLKSFGLPIGSTLLLVVVAGVLQALLFSVVLPRVKGITFALVTLGLAEVFYIVIQSRELGDYTGSDVGLQGVVAPEFLNPSTQHLRLYFIILVFTFLVYLVYRRFVDSPTGRVCIAIRENEGRVQMLGYNPFYFKLAALTLSSITAALAGFLYTIHSPIVTPNVAGMGYTVSALLMILIGGVGTLSGALIGAGIYRLLDFGLLRYFGEYSSFISGAIYVAIVLFLPYGIVGTWNARRFRIKEGWKRWMGIIRK
jgi:branched-chain amino acid transport system permease protein